MAFLISLIAKCLINALEIICYPECPYAILLRRIGIRASYSNLYSKKYFAVFQC